MKKHKTTHEENLDRLSRAEGQIRGVRRMVEDGAHCIDIITQLQAVKSALNAISQRILQKHIEHCVVEAVQGKSKKDAREKIDELMAVMQRQLK